MHFLGFFDEVITEVRMCDGDELLCPLRKRPAAKARNAVLGDYAVNVVLACGADPAGGEYGLYLADGAALRGGGKGDKALTAL